MPNYWKQAERELAKKEQKGTEKTKIEEWQKYWREAGPIRFAEEILTCPLDVPQYPSWQTLQTEEKECICGNKHKKFRENGTPYHVILSEEQKTFLYDLWKRGYSQVLLSAARGAGKTFILAIYNSWIVATHDKKSITCMAGSSNQSEINQDYLDDWRIDVSMLNMIINKSVRGIKHYIKTVGRSKIEFPACSPESARGKHVNIVEIDEAATAEDKSVDGAKAVAAVQWQTTGKRDTQIILMSTAHYIQGMFYEYMTKPEYGFIVYRWATAKHISGETDPMKIYTDKDPNNWIPNVWWITSKEIQDKRRSKSDEEWLCEALGGASMASGAVFKKKDLDIVICNLCDECEPYTWNKEKNCWKCKLCELGNLGTPENPIKYIIDRFAGFDFGISDAPCAITVVGRKNDTVFVLFNDEQIGLREEEKVGWIHDNCQNYGCWSIIPDPAVGGKHLNEPLEELGYAIHIIPEDAKTERVYNVINHVEKHKMIIPMAYWYLTQSMRKLAWDRNHKIRKIDDHSFDSLQYAVSDYNIDETESFIEELLKDGGIKPPKAEDVFKL